MGTAITALQRLATPAQSCDSLRSTHPQRLDGAHEAIRVYLALYGPKTSAVLILALLQRGQLTYLSSSPAMGNQGYKRLHNVRRINDAVADRYPEMVEKEGGFRHQHGPMMAPSILADNPKSGAKLVA